MISVVVPCHNEALSIQPLQQRLNSILNSYGEDFEIIIIDDGSSDNSLEVLRSIDDARIRYASFSRNFGKEAAMLMGLQRARGDRVIIIDGDLQHPPELIRKLLDEQSSSGADQVIARRIRTTDSLRRKLFTKLYYHFVNRLSDVEILDGAGDFRLLTRRAVDALLLLTERNRFSKGLFSWIGFSSAYVDYNDHSREFGQSSWTLRDLVNYGLDGVMSFNTRPLRSMILVGLSTICVFFSYLIWIIIDAIFVGIVTPGYITLVAIVIFLGGIQLLSIGIIGEYVGRTFLESKNRPHFIIAEESQ